METFDYPYHAPNDEYPGGSTIKFGRGYRFAARPPGPDEVIVHLHMPAMFAFQRAFGDPLNEYVEPRINVFHLEDFYKRHRMYQPFYFPHARLGTVICRFNKPLVMPKPDKSRTGEFGAYVYAGETWRMFQMEPFDLELLIQP